MVATLLGSYLGDFNIIYIYKHMYGCESWTVKKAEH